MELQALAMRCDRMLSAMTRRCRNIMDEMQ
jgi:hypothetical protein